MKHSVRIAIFCSLIAVAACHNGTIVPADLERVPSEATAEQAGFSTSRLTAAVDIMRQAVDDGRVTGAQLLVARHGRVVVHEALGLRDLERRLPMKKNTLLRMASVTKTIVATGVLMLADQGRLDIADPVSRYLDGFSEGMSARLTVRDLLRHTTGFPYTLSSWVGDITPKSLSYPDAPSLRVEAFKIGKEGPEVEPGTRCQYSNWGYTVLGAVLEAVSGQKLDAFLHEHLYVPLAMSDSSHASYGIDPARVSVNYQWNGERWDVLPPFLPPFARGSGGLVSTARDYARVAQLYLNEGHYGGRRLLNPETIAEATRLQTTCPYLWVGPERLRQLGKQPMWYYARDRRERGLDVGYGHGWAIAKDGAFSHGGFRGTFVLIDPSTDLAILVFAQSRLGGSPGQEFIEAVYEAIVE